MITQEKVRDLFVYDPSTGILTNRIGRRKAIKGSVAGGINGNGYLTVKIYNKTYRVHRIIFLYNHGYLPKYVDHADGIKTNNKISNLRDCSSSENNSNRKTPKSNKSGCKGIFWNNSSGMWSTRISINKKLMYFGDFSDKEVAEQVLRIERMRLHGEFANHD